MDSSPHHQRRPTRVPEDADLLGSFGGFDLFYEFAHGKYSARLMAYVYVARPDSETISFTQVSSVHRRNMGDYTEDEVERRLAVDAVSRAKIRITDRSFDPREIYSIELNAGSME